MRALKWVLMNGVFAALLWAAVAHGVEGAQNIVVVAVWLLLLMTPLMWTADMQKTLAERGRAVPAWLDGLFDVALVAVLLWHGWMFTGVAYLLHAWLSHGAWNVALRKPANVMLNGCRRQPVRAGVRPDVTN